MSRNEKGLKKALKEIPDLRNEFWENMLIPGEANMLNKYLEYAGRIADFMELGELMAMDALNRSESCGGHFREEAQTPEGEAKRDDENFAYVSAWEHLTNGKIAKLQQESLEFENVKLTQRSYK